MLNALTMEITQESSRRGARLGMSLTFWNKSADSVNIVAVVNW